VLSAREGRLRCSLMIAASKVGGYVVLHC
jgi:hypothetical protein